MAFAGLGPRTGIALLLELSPRLPTRGDQPEQDHQRQGEQQHRPNRQRDPENETRDDHEGEGGCHQNEWQLMPSAAGTGTLLRGWELQTFGAVDLVTT